MLTFQYTCDILVAVAPYLIRHVTCLKSYHQQCWYHIIPNVDIALAMWHLCWVVHFCESAQAPYCSSGVTFLAHVIQHMCYTVLTSFAKKTHANDIIEDMHVVKTNGWLFNHMALAMNDCRTQSRTRAIDLSHTTSLTRTHTSTHALHASQLATRSSELDCPVWEPSCLAPSTADVSSRQGGGRTPYVPRGGGGQRRNLAPAWDKNILRTTFRVQQWPGFFITVGI